MMVQQARKRILIVDDDPDVRIALASLLDQSYSVVTAGDGLEGLRAALTVPPPDLILTDVAMPVLDGILMVHRIRELSPHKIPVIFLTAHDDPMHTIAGISAGARHYMVKPVDLQKLESRIRKLLRGGLTSISRR